MFTTFTTTTNKLHCAEYVHVQVQKRLNSVTVNKENKF
jgi:hypothetical protein